MKIYHDIEQGSSEWFELKHGKIGGTRSKQLFVKSDTLLIELISETIEPYDEDLESYKSDAMENGQMLEPQARFELEKYTGVNFLEVGWIQSDNNLLGVSPDGISDCATIGCEIKCPESKKHIKTCLNDEIPLDNINQCIHNFAVNPKLEKFYFVSYRPEFEIKPLFVKMINRESEVNIGTESKPIIKTVSDVVEEIHKHTQELEAKITESINKLKF